MSDSIKPRATTIKKDPRIRAMNELKDEIYITIERINTSTIIQQNINDMINALKSEDKHKETDDLVIKHLNNALHEEYSYKATLFAYLIGKAVEHDKLEANE